MKKELAESELGAHLTGLIEEAARRGETIVVERAGQAFCTITPAPKPFTAADLARWLETLEWPDADFGRDLEAASKADVATSSPSPPVR